MTKSKKIVIIGDSAFAEVAYECFTHDSEYEVIGFAVESAYLSRNTLFNLPVVPFEEIKDFFPPHDTYFYAALVYSQLNRLRTRLYLDAKFKGYKPASYISSKAFIWQNVILGEHCFILEDNTLQPFVSVGDNVVLWSGNHVGHHSIVRDNCFVASHTVISGFCVVGEYSFVGVNATLSNNITVAEDNWIGAGVSILKNTEPNQLFRGEQIAAVKIPARRFFKVK